MPTTTFTPSPTLSDLFFNHTHDKFDVVVVNSKATHEECEKAINEDAAKFVEDFVGIVPEIGCLGESAADASRILAKDFLERL